MKSDHESDNNYKWITRQINPKWRLIVYEYGTGSAFALQRKDQKIRGWRSQKYFSNIKRALQVIKDLELEHPHSPK